MRSDGLARAFPWLDRTGQLWKMRVTLLLLVVTLASFAAFLWSVNRQTEHTGGASSLWFDVAGGVLFAWLALAFRCPRCQARVCWLLMKSHDHTRWFQEMMQLRQCPRCRELV